MLTILYEDNHLLAVVKPAGLATMGVAAGRPSLVTEARQYIKTRYAKPGNVYLGVVSRLDEPVGGVVLLARTSKAAARLSAQFRGRTVEKTYWAIVDGEVDPAGGEWTDFLVKDEPQRRMKLVGRQTAGAQEARLAFRPLKRLPSGSLLEISLETGRKHQIRVQSAGHGMPILGDRKYGSTRAFPAGIALWARRLAFDHPTTGQRIELVAPLPKTWRRFGVAD